MTSGPNSKNIALVGFMGSGKSLVSKELAKRWNRKIISTDRLIEEKDGRPINEIFNSSGEESFRKLENDVVFSIKPNMDVIIDCGGGVVLNQENMAHLKQIAVLIYLSASADKIYENIKIQEGHGRKRPLLQVENPKERIVELMAKRLPLYQQAPYTVDANQSIGAIADQIEEIVNND